MWFQLILCYLYTHVQNIIIIINIIIITIIIIIIIIRQIFILH